MISIRKQLFTIFIGIGFIMMFSTSLIVNVSIRHNFEIYIDNNIKEAGDGIVLLVERLYESGEIQSGVAKQAVFENYMGNFVVNLCTPDKELVWGKTKEEFVEGLDSEALKYIDRMMYREEERPVYNKDGELIAYVVIGYYPSTALTKNDLIFQKNVNTSIMWCSSMILMWVVLAGLYISRLFTYHIYGISRTSIALADGKLSARYPLKSKIKEIETLRHSMNYLGEKLEKQDTIRKKLISDISHEIRTPLHILQSNLEAMIDGIYPIDETQMNVLYQEVVRFGKLLNNLDLLKNVEESESRMKFAVINLNESVQEVVDAFKIVAKEKKIAYHFKAHETEKVMVWADKDALKQLWMNILSNAFKFTDTKGEIKVWTTMGQKECNIIIQDTGIGIAEEDLPFVFERMYRGDKSREQYQGSGIGLTMVRNIVEKHEGKVDIESVEGKYTKITVTLPIHMMMLEPNTIGGKLKWKIK